MTLRHCFKVRRLILTAALIAGLSLAAHATAQERPFLVDLKSRTTTDLGTLGGNRTVASGINDAGQVTGYSITSEFDWHAFITGPDGMGMRDLGTLGGGFSQAYGINNAGQVVGQSDKSRGSPLSQPFITSPDGVGMRELGALGGIYDRPTGINDAGQVVGSSYTDEDRTRHAFVTGPDGEGMIDLNSLVDMPAGLILYEARAINNAGQVIASAITPAVPEPEIPALFLAGLCLIGFMARRKKAENPG